MKIPLNERIDKTKLERHPSGDGWLVPMRSGEKAQVLCFERKGFQETILGLDEDSQTLGWLPDGRFIGPTHEHRYDLMLDAYIDPYAELKAAHAAGKVIQVQWTSDIGTDRWDDIYRPDWTLPASQYRIKPDWTLTDHMRRFFPTWDEATMPLHRNDFTEDMLPDGWRPLLLNEPALDGDEIQRTSKWSVLEKDTQDIIGEPTLEVCCNCRTRRPLPEVKKSVPLGPEDVPPGSAVRHGETLCWQLVLSTGEDCVFIEGDHIDFEDLQKDEWKISRDGGKTWEACSK